MPPLRAGEAAVCESKFLCQVQVEVEISSGAGEPTAQDWADELGTIHYAIVTGVHRHRVARPALAGVTA